MKFKVGQKVRIKEWDDMPEDVFNVMGGNSQIGDAEDGGVVESENNSYNGYKAYDVKMENCKCGFFCFEQELEPFVKVGEQLIFSFME